MSMVNKYAGTIQLIMKMFKATKIHLSNGKTKGNQEKDKTVRTAVYENAKGAKADFVSIYNNHLKIKEL